MKPICLINLGDNERHGYIIGARLEESDPAYSKYLEVGFNRTSVCWRDDTPHLHTNSDEFFVVLKGRIDLLVNEKAISVEAGHLLGIPSGVAHQVVGGYPTIENFLIRVPGGGQTR